jgi:hypothetical protein
VKEIYSKYGCKNLMRNKIDDLESELKLVENESMSKYLNVIFYIT